jgi:hypothetical protein
MADYYFETKPFRVRVSVSERNGGLSQALSNPDAFLF